MVKTTRFINPKCLNIRVRHGYKWMIYMFEKITREEYQKDLENYIELSKKQLDKCFDDIKELLVPNHPENNTTLAVLLSENSTVEKLMYAITENTRLCEEDKLASGFDDIYFRTEDGSPSKLDAAAYKLMVDTYNDAIQTIENQLNIDELNDTEGGSNIPEYRPSELGPEGRVSYV